MPENETRITAADKNWKCGIVRPISPMDGYNDQHWVEVHNIIDESLTDRGFDISLVSESQQIGVIHGRIIKNLYESDLIICDISCNNANVMFELGVRLAFDKPTIIIKDDVTSFSFDTSPLEHLEYPSDLRYTSILDFKERLAKKAVATVKAPLDPEYRSFLQHFGPIQVPKLDHIEVSSDKYIIEELRELKSMISAPNKVTKTFAKRPVYLSIVIDISDSSDSTIEEVKTSILDHEYRDRVKSFHLAEGGLAVNITSMDVLKVVKLALHVKDIAMSHSLRLEAVN